MENDNISIKTIEGIFQKTKEQLLLTDCFIVTHNYNFYCIKNRYYIKCFGNIKELDEFIEETKKKHYKLKETL